MKTGLRDIQEVVHEMGIDLPKKSLLSKIGKTAVGLYREKYFRDPPKIQSVVYGKTYQVYGYSKENYLLVLEAVLRTLSNEWTTRKDQFALLRLKMLQEDYDLLMLGILDSDIWESLSTIKV